MHLTLQEVMSNQSVSIMIALVLCLCVTFIDKFKINKKYFPLTLVVFAAGLFVFQYDNKGIGLLVSCLFAKAMLYPQGPNKK